MAQLEAGRLASWLPGFTLPKCSVNGHLDKTRHQNGTGRKCPNGQEYSASTVPTPAQRIMVDGCYLGTSEGDGYISVINK